MVTEANRSKNKLPIFVITASNIDPLSKFFFTDTFRSNNITAECVGEKEKVCILCMSSIEI